MKILYIEDNQITRMIAAKILEKNHQLTMASSAIEGIMLGATEPYDVVLIDLNLNDPDMDGFTVLKKLRYLQSTHRPIYVAHTNYISDDMERKCKEEGFDYFLPKPLKSNSLDYLFNA